MSPKPEPQKGKNFHYFVKWDDAKLGGRYFECNLLEKFAAWKSTIRIKAHDGDVGTYDTNEVFKIGCKPSKGDTVIAYWDNRAYAFLGK